MKDCGCEDCYSCKRTYCINSCYNYDCSSREDISSVSGNGCIRAYGCIGFISRRTYLRNTGE